MKGVIILGFPKCGTTSLLEYLKKKYDMEVAREKGFVTSDFKDHISRK